METERHASAVLGVAQLPATIGEELERLGSVLPLQRRLPTIHRVFPRIRREDSRVYEPKLISIGPLHRGKEGLRAMEVHKRRYLQDLLSRNPASCLDKCVARVAARVDEIRAQYSEALGAITDEELVRMMVLDGGFITELLIKSFLRDVDAAFTGAAWTLPCLWNDLLLPENQIPFFVLETLFMAAQPRSFTITLPELALLYVSSGQVRALSSAWGTYPPTPFLHWLHLYHFFLVSQPRREPPHSWWRVTCHQLRRMKKMTSHAGHSVVSLLTCDSPEGSSGESPGLSVHIPRASKLKESGVRFKSMGINMWQPFSVRFADGTLLLPYLLLNAFTYRRLQSFVTFEQCCPFAGTCFTSLADLMSMLLETDGDVALVQDSGAVQHELGSPGEAVLFFRKLCRDVYLAPDRHYYAPVIKEVNDYCEADRRRFRRG